jgi:N utilization substance protein A
MRGSRVQAVVAELQNEKIDIIPYSTDTATYVVNALAPAEVTKIVLDEENNKVEVVVPDEHLSLAIGRRGQNVRLACQLTGWDIDILTEGAESERRIEEMNSVSKMFIDSLNVDEVIAQLLATEGFISLEAVAYVPIEDLQEIEGFDPQVATELKERAIASLKERDKILQEELKKLKVKKELINFEGLTVPMVVALGKEGIKNVEGLADLANDEFKEILGTIKISTKDIDEIIMKARAPLFEKISEGEDEIEDEDKNE